MGIWRSFEAHSGLPELHLLLTSDPGEIEDFLYSWKSKYHFGLDLEWKPSFQKGQPPSRSAVLSICAGPWILAVDLLPWRKQTCEPLCEGLWSFLENEQNTFYGMGLVGDLARLAFEFDCVCDGVDFNLRGWSSLQPLSGGLTGLANRVLGTSVEQSKAVTRSNWNLRPLSEIQMLYIAEDAYMSWKIAMTLLQTECKVQEDWFVTMAEMYGSGKEFWQHGLTVPESCHDWSMAQHEWQLKQEAKKQKLRDKEIERRKKAETRKRALEACAPKIRASNLVVAPNLCTTSD